MPSARMLDLSSSLLAKKIFALTALQRSKTDTHPLSHQVLKLGTRCTQYTLLSNIAPVTANGLQMVIPGLRLNSTLFTHLKSSYHVFPKT